MIDKKMGLEFLHLRKEVQMHGWIRGLLGFSMLGTWIGLESVLCLMEAHSPLLDVVSFQGAYVSLAPCHPGSWACGCFLLETQH